jgi:predicted nuclease of predicted toxin-antitoxin system
VKILLDENFPLALFRTLRADGQDVEHIITLGWRGAPDQRIRQRLTDHDLLFLTQALGAGTREYVDREGARVVMPGARLPR